VTKSSDSERLRVMIVDDHALFRRGLEMVLGEEEDLELIGEASDGQEAVEKAQDLMPDVVLMDVRMPRRSGIEATAQIRDLLPHVKILMLTISDDEADLYDASRPARRATCSRRSRSRRCGAIRSVWAASRASPVDGVEAAERVRGDVKATDERPPMPSPG
jgi:DNA-binding NarL/FixJ family response regulator